MEESTEPVATVRVFKYRWVILLIFCLYSAVNFLQFLQYTIISNITAKYYDVESIFVDLTGLIFMICFIIFFLPINYFIERYNLKISAIVSTGLTTCGTLVKLGSASQDRFYLVMIGQVICAVAQVFMLAIPSKLASTWFGAEEVSTACAIAVLGTQIGVAGGSIFSSNFVENSEDMEHVADDLFHLQIINVALTAATFLVVLIFFRAKPSVPPSPSQLEIAEVEGLKVKETFMAMVKSRDYLLLLVAIGSTNGMYTCFGVIVNTVYLNYFPGHEAEIGIITAAAVIAGGCVGSLVFGFLLDKFHHFKMTTFCVIIFSGVTYIFVVVSMELESQLATYFTIPLFGFFIASTLLIGFEFATEIMYPMSETACCSVLTTVIYIFTVIYTLIFTALMDAIGYIPCHIIITVLIFLSSSVVYFISPRLRRREANVVRDE